MLYTINTYTIVLFIVIMSIYNIYHDIILGFIYMYTINITIYLNKLYNYTYDS